MQQDFKRTVNGSKQSPVTPVAVGQPESVLPSPAGSVTPAPSVNKDVNGVNQPDDGQSPKKKRTLAALLIAGSLLTLAAVIGFAVWFSLSLQPRDAGAGQKRVTIAEGSSLAQMSSQLEEEEIIRSSTAFQMYVRLQNLQGTLQAGMYVFSPSQSVQDIASRLTEGKVDAFRITILPGQTLKNLKVTLEEYGFKSSEIDSALTAAYDHPLLATKPANATLEGCIYPETYEIQGSGSVNDLFLRSFDEMYQRMTDQNIIQQLKDRNVSLHDAVIMASVIQMEVPKPDDQRQVSQIIYKRLAEDMPLGMDSTSVYVARQRGIEPVPSVIVNIDSPYNTRNNTGLPPGPIANFNLSAIQAVGSPAPGNYLYFVSGDGQHEGNNYYSETLEEHEANTARYCTELCR